MMTEKGGEVIAPRSVSTVDLTALERSLCAELRERDSDDAVVRPALVIAPTRLLVDHLQRVLVREERALLGVHLVTFATLVRSGLEHSFRLPPRSIPNAALETCLTDALDEMIVERAEGAERIAQYPGALRGALGTCRELRDAGVPPEALRALPATAGAHPLLPELYARYSARIDSDADWSDEAATVRASIAHVGSFLRNKGIDRVFVYGAYELVGYNLELLEEIARHAPVSYFVPASSTGRAFEYAKTATSRFPGFAISPPPPSNSALDSWWTRFAALYDPGASLPPFDEADGKALEIAHAQGPQDELRTAALRALAIVTEDCPSSPSPDEVLIVARTLDPYLPFLESTFEDLGLPLVTTARAPLRRDARTNAFLRYLQVLTGDLERLAVFGILRSTRISLFEARPSDDTVDAWDRRTRAERIHGGIDAWRSLLDVSSGRSPSDRRQVETESLVPLVELAESLERQRLDWERAESPSDQLEFLRRLSETVLARPNDAEDDDEDAETTALDRVFEIFADWVESSELGRSSPRRSSPLETLRLLEQIAEERKLRLGTSRSTGAELPRGGVRVVDLMQARAVSARVVIWIGFHDGLFPRKSRVDPYLPDAARQALRESTGKPLSLRAHATDEERLLLALTIAAARERVVISFQRADNSGRKQARSSALREVARIFHGRADVAALLDESPSAAYPSIESPPIRVPAHPGDRALALASSARIGLLAGDEAVAATSLASRRPTDAGRAAIDEILGGDEILGRTKTGSQRWFRSSLDWVDVLEAYDVADGVADGNTHLSAVTERPIFATAFERLLRCPLSYFQRYVLGARRVEEEPRLDRFDENLLGNAVHAALEKLYEELAHASFFDAASSSSAERDEERIAEAIARLEELLGEELDSAIGPSRQQLRGLVSILRARWTRVLRRVARRDLSELLTANAEDLHLEGEVRVPLRLRVDESSPSVELVLAGRIDRLWRSTDDTFIDDFKTSGDLKKKLAPSAILQGQDIQLPLYRELIESLGPRDGDAPGKVRARLLGVGPSNEGDPHELKNDARLSEGLQESLAVAARLLEDGRFPFRDEPHRCGYCEFRRTCRRSQEPSIERRENDPALRDFRDIARKSSRGAYTLAELRERAGGSQG